MIVERRLAVARPSPCESIVCCREEREESGQSLSSSFGQDSETKSALKVLLSMLYMLSALHS